MSEQHSALAGGSDGPASADDVLLGVAKMFHVKFHEWTDADTQILRQHYTRGGLLAVRPLLPHKTDGAIYKKARKLRVKAPGYKRQTEQYSTTQFIDEAIVRYYRGTPRKGGASKLAHQIHRPVTWVYQRARQLGVVVPRFQDKPWSEREIELLRQYASNVPQTISRKFHRYGFKRTAGAISIKLMKLRCDRTDEDHYSASALAELMGVTVHSVSAWISKGWLTAKTKGTARPRDEYKIHRNAVRRFIIENVGAFDIRRVEKHWFVDLVAGNS